MLQPTEWAANVAGGAGVADSVGPKMIGETEDSQWNQITKVS